MMKKLTLFCLSALAAFSLASCGKEDDTDMRCTVAVVDAQVATVGFTATLDASEIGDGARFEILSSTIGDPGNPANMPDVGLWTASTAEENSRVDIPKSGRNWYNGFYSKNLVPGAKYYVRIRFVSNAGGQSVERLGPLSQFQMPDPGEPYIGASGLSDITSTSVKVHAIWMPNGQKISSIGYLISTDEKEINENKGTTVTLDSPLTYDFQYTDLEPGKMYYTKLWCQTTLPDNPTKYHVSLRFYSNKVYFTTAKE